MTKDEMTVLVVCLVVALILIIAFSVWVTNWYFKREENPSEKDDDSIIDILLGVFCIFAFDNFRRKHPLLSALYDHSIEDQQQQIQQQIQQEQIQQHMDWSMEECRKAGTPFEMGGYDMTQGNSFNNFDNFGGGGSMF